MESKMTLAIPYGTRDFLPQEAAAKRTIESKLMELFTRWGYDEIVTPVLEFLDTLTMGNGQRLEPRMFKLIDRNNRTLALRHEMTTPIARVMASRLKDAPRPARISYVSNVYRYEQAQTGRQCEFYQAGVEFMGSAAAAADAEVVALAIASMRAAGLKDFKVCIGQAAFISGLMQQFGLSEAEQAALGACMEKHDLVGLRVLVDGMSLSQQGKEMLCDLPLLHGGHEVLLRAQEMAVNEQSRRAILNLFEIARLLEGYGVMEYVSFDLGVIRDLGYYTGMVFEAYTPGLGFSVCGGGRYDRMLSDFGNACPATGFALGIERILLALEREGLPRPQAAKDVYVAYAAGKESDAIAAAAKERTAGRVTELSPSAQSRDEAAAYQAAKGYASLVYLA